MKKLIYGFLLLFSVLHANAQQIGNALAKYLADYGEERMYFQYDKSGYVPGETIWFKAYLMKALFPSEDSKTVYADFYDEEGHLLKHHVLAVDDATTFGQFEIPANYTGQWIHLRAYTKWMLNFDPEFLYNKDIRIVSKKSAAPVPKNAFDAELSLFPEGGDAIEGVTNKIAFKVNDSYGRPVQVKGVVLKNNLTVIDSLRVLHDGIGYFFIIPADGDTFSVSWEDDHGAHHVTPLPAIKKTGVSLRVTLSAGRRNFSVYATPALAAAVNEVHILGTMYQQQVFELEEVLTNGAIEGSVPTESLPTGILTITVFDSQWKPLAERITYINNEECYFQPQISVTGEGAGKRAKNKIRISVPEGLVSSLSVAVTDSAIGGSESDPIISHLLLTGQLKGYVHDPAHYFLNNSDSISNQLDLVMLTHGWRRFNWEQVARGQFPVIHYPRDTDYLYLSGKVLGMTPAQLQKAGDILLMLSQDTSGTQVFTLPVQPNGYFSDPSFLLFDTARIFYNFSHPKGIPAASVQFMPDLLPPFLHSPAPVREALAELTNGDTYHIHLSDEAQDQLKYFKGKVLATVKITSRVKSPRQELNDQYTTGLFKAGNATELDLVHDPMAVTYTDIVSYIQGKVPGLSFDNVARKFVWLRNRSGENGPTLYLNEIGTTYDNIGQIPVANVAYIKVFRPGFVGGTGSGSGGAIVIYTRMGEAEPGKPVRGLDNYLVEGYSVVRQFYSPDYEAENPVNTGKDLRTTLYWNPSVTTTPDRSAVELTFYNNDVTRTLKIVIEGMSKEGRLAHIEQVIN